jgi:hypothetical protein
VSEIIAIGWAFGVLVAVWGIYLAWGDTMLVQMFPEGHRWWMPWTRLASLLVFSAVVLANPFNGWLS